MFNLLSHLLRRGIAWQARRRVTRLEGTVAVRGLGAPVEVLQDAWGVPHLYAQQAEDLLFGQGFLHASHRLWQMELNRRIACGRLSEWFGEAALTTDRAARVLGFARLGRRAWLACPPALRAWVEAYVRGINAALSRAEGRLPVEFLLAGREPEPWTPAEVFAFSQFMMWQLSHAWFGEWVRARLVQAAGPEAAAELEPAYPAGNPVLLPGGIPFNRLDPSGFLEAAAGPLLDRGYGSNAWVLSPRRTDTGGSVLCNDVHLSLSLPSVFYAMHLHAPGLHVAGGSIPGLPTIMVGHNERIAWGLTLAFTDCEDLVVERFEPDSIRYHAPAGLLEPEQVEEIISIRGRRPPHRERVLLTRHGPVVSGLLEEGGARMALQSMALRPSCGLLGWMRLNQARDWNDFVEAMRPITAPQLAVTYADVEGNIGFWTTGTVPIRRSGLGLVPTEGATGAGDWVGEVPFASMPHALNPPEGFLVTCNQKLVGDEYPYFLGASWMNGFRSRRITERIQSQNRIGLETCASMQLDLFCIPGKELAARLEDLQPRDPLEVRALEALRSWDGHLSADSVGGALYQVFRYTLLRRLLEPVLGREWMHRYMGQGFHPQLQFGNEFHGHETSTLLRLLDQQDSSWVRRLGGRSAWLREAWSEAVRWLRKELGEEMNQWTWGRLHQVRFRHAFAARPWLDPLFSRGPFPVGGDSDTPCQAAVSPEDPYACRAWAVSYRQIIDLAHFSRSRFLLAPGQSGQLGSRHYDDLIPLWLRGDYVPMLWEKGEVEGAVAQAFRLTP